MILTKKQELRMERLKDLKIILENSIHIMKEVDIQVPVSVLLIPATDQLLTSFVTVFGSIGISIISLLIKVKSGEID
jgi:hypothetical protein